MSPGKAAILAAVLAAPDGLTTQQVIAKFGAADYLVRTALSRLYAYGSINKQPIDGRTALWKRPEKKSCLA